MASITLEGTTFSFAVEAPSFPFRKDRAVVTIGLKNEHISYEKKYKNIVRDDLEEWIFSMFRILAGAYKKEQNFPFENAGFAIDLYPYTEEGVAEVSRQKRRENDCVMAVRLLMKSGQAKTFLGGVYTLLFHRKDIATFAKALREEFDGVYGEMLYGKGKYLFAGVSPLGYNGCNYWYYEPTDTVEKGDYVWVKMGRHQTEQIVYVDSVRRFTEDTAPFNPERVKRVLRKATPEEIKEIVEK